jgi:EAL domain-containing protein (putative c-di-GMP-specific phosphodiesterase class I)
MTSTTFTHPHHRQDVDSLLAGLERDHFPASSLGRQPGGSIVARFFQSLLTSSFQPIVRARDHRIEGHHAQLRVYGDHGGAASPWNLLAQASDDSHLVQLDRLSRTLHALNYFPGSDSRRTLFVNVEPRLLTTVRADHGAYFEVILGLLRIPTSRVAIVMPAAGLDEPVTYVRAAISYRIRGYHVFAQLRADADADLEHVLLADPHYVGFDPARCAHPRRIIDTVAHRGGQVVAQRVDDEATARAARSAGFHYLQGRFINPRLLQAATA